VVDTLGLLLVVMVTAASVQDRDGGRAALRRARLRMPSLLAVWADGGYAGRVVDWGARRLRLIVLIVRKIQASTASRCCPDAGWWNAPCPGSAVADAWPTTTNVCPNTPKPWSNGP